MSHRVDVHSVSFNGALSLMPGLALGVAQRKGLSVESLRIWRRQTHGEHTAGAIPEVVTPCKGATASSAGRTGASPHSGSEFEPTERAQVRLKLRQGPHPLLCLP